MSNTTEQIEEFSQRFMVKPDATINLKKDYAPGDTPGFKKPESAEELLQEGIRLLSAYQDRLYAENTRALLVVLQALDAGGKDGVIKHVMSGVNPQGCQVYSFKAPSGEELDHDYLWRCYKALPERGRIGIFNRSHYEEVLVVRVHPGILAGQQMPASLKDEGIWKRRFEEINNFERQQVNNGTEVVKIFLNVSKEEQKQRFLDRINQPEKNWKFSADDVKERGFWDDYMGAFEDVFNHTSTSWAPWHIVPADNKWYTRMAVAAIIAGKLIAMDPQYPTVTQEHQRQLLEAKNLLLNENG